MDQIMLSKLPKVDVLLALPALADSGIPRYVLKQAIRAQLDELREGPGGLPGEDALLAAILRRAGEALRVHPRRVVNATGVVLHTNLGRAPLSPAAVAAMEASAGYCDLEYDAAQGRRGDRGEEVSALLRTLTGAEDALVVGNNAAAVLLLLSALGKEKGVALSRGELVEIGGSFRMPDVMAQSGAVLVEVGTTNRTRQTDYRAVIEDGSAQLLLKVHTSNYKIVGFTEEASLAELVGLGRGYNLPVLYDLGSGQLLPSAQLGLPPGPSVAESVRAGATVVTFSGDKLLGGPQAGILVGRHWAVDAARRHPLFRALRPDKSTLAALEATLRLYADPQSARREIPVLSMLSATAEELKPWAEALAARLKKVCGRRCAVAVTAGESEAGGGSLPGVTLPTWLVTLSPSAVTPEALEAALRAAETPVVACLRRGTVQFDVRTVGGDDAEALCAAVGAAL